MRRLVMNGWLWVAVAVATSVTAEPRADWKPPAAELIDPMLQRPSVVALDEGGQSQPLVLPFSIETPEGPRSWLRIEADGALELLDRPFGTLDLAVVGDEDAAGALPDHARYEVLVGERARLGERGRVLLEIRKDAFIVRWLGLEIAGRSATVEAVLHQSGAVRYQYYSLPPDLVGTRAGYRGRRAIQLAATPASGVAYDLDFAIEPLTEVGQSPAEELSLAECSNCPASEPTWLQELAVSGRICAPRWDPNGDGNPADGTGCSCSGSGATCTGITCAGTRRTLRSRPTTTVDTMWEFDEAAYCIDCPYRFYILVECGTEMHLPLWDMEGVRVQVTEVLTGEPVPLTCRNEAAMGSDLWFSGCTSPATRYTYPSFDVTNAGDPAMPLEWGFPTSCKGLPDLDTNRNGRVDCSELPANPGGTVPLTDIVPDFSPGEGQMMDCQVGDAAGLCGVYRVDISSGGFVWQLYSNCAGDGTENFRIFDSCASACAAFAPLPELTVQNLTVADCGPGASVSFEIANIGCSEADTLEYRIETDCPTPDIITGSVAGSLAANGSVQVVEVLNGVGCAPPFDVTVYVDPTNRLSECSESATAAKCADIPGADSATVLSCGCDAAVTATVSTTADGWCAGNPPPTLDAADSVVTGCRSGQLEYRWWKDAVGIGAPLAGWRQSSTYVPDAEAGIGLNDYVVEVRCVGESCGYPAIATVERTEAVVADAGADGAVCAGGSVVLGGLVPAIGGDGAYTFSWTSTPPGLIAAGEESLPNPTTLPLTANASFELNVVDGLGCEVSDSVDIVVNDVPVADAGTALRTLCSGSELELGGSPTATGGDGNYVYAWTSNPPALIVPGDEGDPNPATLPILAASRFELQVTDGNGCAAPVVTVDVDVLSRPEFQAGDDREVCDGYTSRLGVGPTATGGDGNYTYLWSNVGPSAITPGEENLANPTTTALSGVNTFTVTVTDGLGCAVASNVTLTAVMSAPPPIGNTFKLVRPPLRRDDVDMVWVADPSIVYFRLQRGLDKAPSYAEHPSAGVLNAPLYTEATVMTEPDDYYYQVGGDTCFGRFAP